MNVETLVFLKPLPQQVMTMFNNILVPLDGSKTAEMVLPYILELFDKTDVRACLVRVLDKESLVRDCHVYLEGLVKDIMNRARKDPSHKPQITTEVLFFDPVEAIINFANGKQFELIVIASRGASNQPRWPLGNVALKILRISTIPVLIVKKPPDNVPGTADSLIKRILIPLDGSKLSENAIPYGLEMARLTKSELILTQVIQHVEVPSGSPATGITWHVGDYENYLRSQAETYLGKIAKGLQNAVKDVATQVLVGNPAEQIMGYSEKNGIDLIVMSSHGRSGISRWFFGSVTEKILNGGDKPVLIIRQSAR